MNAKGGNGSKFEQGLKDDDQPIAGEARFVQREGRGTISCPAMGKLFRC
jgi:hypothetical protein